MKQLVDEVLCVVTKYIVNTTSVPFVTCVSQYPDKIEGIQDPPAALRNLLSVRSLLAVCMPKSRKRTDMAKAGARSAAEVARIDSYKAWQAKMAAKDARQAVANTRAQKRAAETAKNKPAPDDEVYELEPEWVEDD